MSYTLSMMLVGYEPEKASDTARLLPALPRLPRGRGLGGGSRIWGGTEKLYNLEFSDSEFGRLSYCSFKVRPTFYPLIAVATFYLYIPYYYKL